MHENKRLGQAEIRRLVATSTAGTTLLDFIMLPGSGGDGEQWVVSCRVPQISASAARVKWGINVQIFRKVAAYSHRISEKNAAGFQLTFQYLMLGFRLSGQAAMGLRDKLMRFLFRMIFWLGVVLILLPTGGTRTSSESSVSAGDAMSAARATVDDASSFCERQPEACAIGSQAAAAIGHRASVGAKMLYDYLNGHFGAENGGAGKSMARPATRLSHDTLTQTDLAPTWRGLRARTEARLDHPQ